jgi:NodT family efflux transporter outer membrane factor (OMF) lipoprotein
LKKILASAVLISILGNLPAYAVTEQRAFKGMPHKENVSNDYYNDYVNLQWWKNFNDNVLNAYIEKAVLNNHDLKMASITVDEYYQNIKLQFANELPKASVGFNTAYVKAPVLGTDWNFVTPGIAQYEADIFLKNHDKTKAVRKLHEASRFDERAAYISVACAVGTTYLNIVKLDKMITLQEEIVSSRKNIHELMLLRNKEGLTSTADTIKADKAYTAGVTDLLELKKQRDILLNQLAVLIGENPENSGRLVRSNLDNLRFTSIIPNEISSEVIMQRPDYLKAEKMVEKAGLDVRVAKKEFLPSINLTGLAIFNANSFGSIFTTSNMIGALAAGAMLPVFTGGAKTANLKLKKHQYERILQNYYKTNLTAIQEVNDAMASIKSDEEKMRLTLKQAQFEKVEYSYNKNRYNQGTISKLDLIQNKENILVMDKIVTQQKIECFVDYIGLYKAAGANIAPQIALNKATI